MTTNSNGRHHSTDGIDASNRKSIDALKSITSRRGFLSAAGGMALTSMAGCLGTSGSEDDVITLGNLSAQSGNAALTGIEKNRATQMAVDEINENGGIMGQEVELLTPDPQSDIQRFQELTRELIQQEEVDALWAGIRSSTREAIRPITNEEEQLYFYTNQYEGGVCDNYCFPVGATSKQKLEALVPYLINEYGGDIYTVAADYVFGQVCAEWTKRIAEENGGQVVNEEFLPLSTSQFGSTINRIQEADPDFMMGILVGQNLNTFYDVRASSDLDIPVGTTTTLTQAYEHIRYEPPAVEDVYAATNFMEELGRNDERASEFVERYQEKFPEAEYMNENAQNNYWSVHLYKKAVEEAGTTDQEAVIDQLEEGMDISAPEGDLSMHGPTHHLSHNIAVARADENHDIEFISRDIVEPEYLQSVGCDLTENEESELYIPGE